jgi:hypothetical protein
VNEIISECYIQDTGFLFPVVTNVNVLPFHVRFILFFLSFTWI